MVATGKILFIFGIHKSIPISLIVYKYDLEQ